MTPPAIIVIFSTSGEVWSKYRDFSWPTIYEAAKELQEPENKLIQTAKEDYTDKYCYFELVDEEYFSRYKKPYSK